MAASDCAVGAVFRVSSRGQQGPSLAAGLEEDVAVSITEGRGKRQGRRVWCRGVVVLPWSSVLPST